MKRHTKIRRRGITMLEGAVALSLLLIFVLGMLDLTLAILRHSLLTDAARQLAREAMIHGSMAASASDRWGTTTIDTTADAGTALTESLRSGIVTMDPHDVNVLVEWIDGSNDADSRVRVTLSYTHRRIVPLVWMSDALELQAVSTMRIAH